MWTIIRVASDTYKQTTTPKSFHDYNIDQNDRNKMGLFWNYNGSRSGDDIMYQFKFD